jgi:RNA polymerase-binding transcription factor DksA
MDEKNLEELRLQLKQSKISIEKQLKSFAKKDPNLKHDWDSCFPKFDGGALEEAADEVEEYVSRLPVEHSLEIKLRDINLALEKDKKGNYGKCANCGKSIDIKRLKACPEAKFCLKCRKD